MKRLVHGGHANDGPNKCWRGALAGMQVAKPIRRLTVCAPQRGKLTLKFDFIDGTSGSVPSTPRAIRQVLSEHDQYLSVEQFAAIAFRGYRCVLDLVTKTTFIVEAVSPFQMMRAAQMVWFAPLQISLGSCERLVAAPLALQRRGDG